MNTKQSVAQLAVPHRKRIDGPALGKAHGLARGVLEIGDAVEADVRGRRVAAEVVALPFYKREK